LNVIPDVSASPREDRLHAQEPGPLTRLSLWVDQADALTIELEPKGEIARVENPLSRAARRLTLSKPACRSRASRVAKSIAGTIVAQAGKRSNRGGLPVCGL
jgi:hypothetical protein